MRYGRFLQGDTLQEFAARELGDGARWVDVVQLNGLAPPYIASAPDYDGEHLAKPGQFLLIGSEDPDTYGIDVALKDGFLAESGGDFALVGGFDNLKAALIRRVRTERGRLYFYPRYGCMAPRMIGQQSDNTTAQLVAAYVSAAIKQDPRVLDANTIGTASGDTVRAEANALVKRGETLTITETF